MRWGSPAFPTFPSFGAGAGLVLFLSRMLVAQAWGEEGVRATASGAWSLADRSDGLGSTALLRPGPGPMAAGNRTEVAATARPFWAIAHRVLVAQGVRDALDHGANAIEMDMYAWKDQWYADHDGTPGSSGDSVEKMFTAVARQRQAGQNVGFVWLDIKNPDWCEGAQATCNIEALQQLARTILQPAGVKVLYDFYSPGGRAFPLVRDSLNDNEAIDLDGRACDVQAAFEAGGGPRNVAKRVLSYGCFALAFRFGSGCSGQARHTCTQLRQGAASGAFGRVFGWTVSKGRGDEAQQLMEAGVDGLIYGFMLTSYYDSADTRATLALLTGWLRKNSNKRYLARASDAPW